MPDWLISIVTAIVGGLFGAGGLVAWQRMRVETRLTAETQQDEHTLKLLNALNADEAAFRRAVYDAYLAEVARNRDLDARLTEVQKQLTITTGERDLTQRQLERTQAELVQTRGDLDKANTKIRQLEEQIAALEQKEHP